MDTQIALSLGTILGTFLVAWGVMKATNKQMIEKQKEQDTALKEHKASVRVEIEKLYTKIDEVKETLSANKDQATSFQAEVNTKLDFIIKKINLWYFCLKSWYPALLV